MNNQVNNKDNDSKKIFTVLIMIFTLMVCTTGATYAYFAISATNNVATGTAATAGITLNVTRVSPNDMAWTVSSKTMVPQLDAALSNAMKGTAGYTCMDGNGNIVCSVYKIEVSNTGTGSVNLRGAIYFTLGENSVFTNLYWRQVTDSTALGTKTIYKYATDPSADSTIAETANATLVSSLLLASNDSLFMGGKNSAEYYVLIWIRETNSDQSSADKGTWVMNVEFKDKAGNGVTSTITS